MTTAILVLLAAFGLMIGSFLNVCIVRLPAGQSIVRPRSRCPGCGAPIAWYDNIPVFSYVLLGGRCRACRRRISVRYPLVEIVTAVGFVFQGLSVGTDLLLLADRLVLTSLLVVLFGTDLDTQRLPDVLTLPGTVAGVLFSVVLPPGLAASLLGAAAGAAALLAVRWGWYLATGVEGMGLGDVKMLALIGAFLGWRQVGVVLFLASLAGAVVGILVIVSRGRSFRARLPFGTFLAAAAFVASLEGERMLNWYLSLYR